MRGGGKMKVARLNLTIKLKGKGVLFFWWFNSSANISAQYLVVDKNFSKLK